MKNVMLRFALYLTNIDMKIGAYRLLLIILVFSIILSCSNDEESGQSPTFEFIADSGYINGSTSVSPGELMKFKVHANQGSDKLTNFFIEVRNINDDITRYFDTALYCSEFNWEGSFYKSAALDEQWMFVIRDRQGLGAGDNFYIYTDTNTAYNPVEIISNIYLGAQDNMDQGGFFSFENQIAYFAPEAKENQNIIDLVSYFYGEDEIVIASPGANIEDGVFPENVSPMNWEIRNTTRFIKTGLTQSDFNNAQNDSILIANYVDAEGKRKAKNLAAGDIYVFKSQLNRLGMFKVNSVSGTDTGLIDFDLKIQSEQK